MGKRETAENQYRSAAGHFNAGRVAEAEVACREALKADRHHLDATQLLALIETKRGNYPAAIELARRAVQRQPADAVFQHTLAVALQGAGMHEEAAAIARRAIALAPNQSMGYLTLSTALSSLRQIEDGIAAAEIAARLDPSAVQAHYNLYHFYLVTGRYDRGWEEFEWRESARWVREACCSQSAPLWEGQPMPDKTLVVQGEQGVGDTIQFLRYLPMVAPRVGRIKLVCQPELFDLARSLRIGTMEFVDRATPMTAGDAHIGIMSLARLFGTRLDCIPGTPYLSAAPERVSRWRDRLAGGAGTCNVGIAWSGSPAFAKNHRRSVRLADYEPLSHVPGMRLHSLQKGPPTEQLRSATFTITDHSAGLTDFAETAALMENLDLIVTVDTSVAHLAGALARPVWMLTGYRADWRWLLDRDDSPWYPTMRLFRQSLPGDWGTAIAAVADALRHGTASST